MIILKHDTSADVNEQLHIFACFRSIGKIYAGKAVFTHTGVQIKQLILGNVCKSEKHYII